MDARNDKSYFVPMRSATTLLLLMALSGAAGASISAANTILSPAETNVTAAGRASAEQRVAELERKNMILEASDRIEDKAYSRFEIGMGGLGLLITLLVIVFGFRTERAAVRAAQAEVADRKTQIDNLVALAKAAAAAAEAAAASAAQHEGRAATSAAHVEETSKAVEEAAKIANELTSRRADMPAPDLTLDQKQTLEQGAKEAKKQREADLTADEFRARIAKAAYVDKDWEEVIRLARGMAFVHADDIEALAYANYEEAFALGQLDRNTEAIQVYDKAVELCRGSDSPSLRDLLITLLFNRGVRLGLLGQHHEEIAAYDEAIGEADRLGNDGGVRENVGRAIYNKGATLSGLERYDEAIATYDELIRRFGEEQSDEFKEQVSRAMFSKAVAVGNTGDKEGEISTYNELFSRISSSDVPSICENLATAQVNKGVALGGLGRLQEEIECYQRAIEEFREIEHSEVALQVAKANLYLGYTFEQVGEAENARKPYMDAMAGLQDVSIEGADALRQQAEAALASLDSNVSEATSAQPHSKSDSPSVDGS